MKPGRYPRIPLEAQYLCRRGMDEDRLGNGARAIGFFRQVILIAPGYARAYHGLADCLVRAGRGTEAGEYFRKATVFGVRDGTSSPSVKA